MLTTVATYLPLWGTAGARVEGDDEDAVTLAVAAGRAALSSYDGLPPPRRVVTVSRGLALLEGGNAAALLAGLDLDPATEVVERVGGAAAALDALLSATPGTLVIGIDLGPGAGAGAAVTGTSGRELTEASRLARSLPVLARDLAGGLFDYSDPRLMRDRGLAESLRRVPDIGRPVAVAGIPGREARALCVGNPAPLPTLGASSVFFALAALGPADAGSAGGDLLLAADQATVTGARLGAGGYAVTRDERAAVPKPDRVPMAGPDIPISLPAYERAFDAKLRLAASTNRDTGALDFPPRAHDAVRDGDGRVVLTPLPRAGEVYTFSTIHVPVPGKATPYQLVIVELDGGVRTLVQTTDCGATDVRIGDRGTLVFRRVELRSGIPDYGYSFSPEPKVAAA